MDVQIVSTEHEQQQLAEEQHSLQRLLELAHKIDQNKDEKAARFKAMIDDFCAKGRKVIVFTEYKDTLDYLYDYLRTHGYEGRIALMHGHLGREARNHQELFFHQPETAILLATDAASEGLNFQHDCWTILHYELAWNPNRLEQRNGRVDRWGQHHQVEVSNMILTDTLEGEILLRLQKKLEKIREELGNVSDVLSVVGTLNEKQQFETLLMEPRCGATGAIVDQGKSGHTAAEHGSSMQHDGFQ